VVGVLQSGAVLNFRTLGTWGLSEVRAITAALRELTGQKIGNKPRAWLRWFSTAASARRFR